MTKHQFIPFVKVNRSLEFVIVWVTDQCERLNGFWHVDGGMIKVYGQQIEFLMIESYKKWQYNILSIEIMEELQEKK